MRYKTVTIRRNDINGTWNVTFEHDKKDRELTETSPHWLGFYHYPETMSDKDAFEKLKNYLISRETQALALVQEKIGELEALSLPLPKPKRGKNGDSGEPKKRANTSGKSSSTRRNKVST